MPRRLSDKSRHQEIRSRNYRGYGRPVQLEQMVRPSPVKEGEEYDMIIEDVGNKGDGICSIKGFRIYVPGAKTGDRVKIRIASIMGNFATASLVGQAQQQTSQE